MLFTRQLVFFGLVLISLALGSPLIAHEKRDDSLSASPRSRIEKEVFLPIRIGLRQNERATRSAEKWLMEVSSPGSPKYGRHWTSGEVIEAFQPSHETLHAVTAWLNSHDVYEFTHSDNKMWFAFDITVEKAEYMLQTEYFEHITNNGNVEAYCDYYHVPAHLKPHIHYITPGVLGSDITGRTSERALPKRGTIRLDDAQNKTACPYGVPRFPPYNSSTSLVHCSEGATPSCIRALYNFSIPDPALPMSPENSLGIFETENQLYYQGDLNELYSYFAPNIPSGTSPIYGRIDGAKYLPNGTHDMNWKYILHGQEAAADIQLALPIIYPQNVTVFELGSYHPSKLGGVNFLNRFLDAIDGSYCTYEQQDNSAHGGKPQCGLFKPTKTISFSYSGVEPVSSVYWMERQCMEYLKLGLQGVSLFFSTGDTGTAALSLIHQPQDICTKKDPHPRVFLPFFPAGCPWITAVGATEIRPGHSVDEPEQGAEWLNGFPEWSGLSSGGGFSFNFEAPGYQKDALSSFFTNYNPPWPYFYNGQYRNNTGRYNRNGRGYPDISAIGTNVTSFTALCYSSFYGTSASTPIVAAIFNRINEERLRVGKGSIGFINPTLYENADALNDIVEGANGFCTRDDGFKAVPGWDPVTGLGTPSFPKLLDVFMRLP